MSCTVSQQRRPQCQRPDETKDEMAIRLRSDGLSFREIATEMGMDVAMAHRRVKRAMLRRRCEQEDRMQDVRDNELEKLRRIEKAILPIAFEGDLEAGKFALRIMEIRRRYLKDQPLEDVPEDPMIELLNDDDSHGEEEGDPLLDPILDGENIDGEIDEEQEALVPPLAAETATQDDSFDDHFRRQTTAYFASLGIPPEAVSDKIEDHLAQIHARQEVRENTQGSTHPPTLCTTLPTIGAKR
jgi:hypothetical protein